MNVIGEVCDCSCHRNECLHCFPCCFHCPSCNENISYSSCGTIGINDFEKAHLDSCIANKKDRENIDKSANQKCECPCHTINGFKHIIGCCFTCPCCHEKIAYIDGDKKVYGDDRSRLAFYHLSVCTRDRNDVDNFDKYAKGLGCDKIFDAQKIDQKPRKLKDGWRMHYYENGDVTIEKTKEDKCAQVLNVDKVDIVKVDQCPKKRKCACHKLKTKGK